MQVIFYYSACFFSRLSSVTLNCLDKKRRGVNTYCFLYALKNNTDLQQASWNPLHSIPYVCGPRNGNHLHAPLCFPHPSTPPFSQWYPTAPEARSKARAQSARSGCCRAQVEPEEVGKRERERERERGSLQARADAIKLRRGASIKVEERSRRKWKKTAQRRKRFSPHAVRVWAEEKRRAEGIGKATAGSEYRDNSHYSSCGASSPVGHFHMNEVTLVLY